MFIFLHVWCEPFSVALVGRSGVGGGWGRLYSPYLTLNVGTLDTFTSLISAVSILRVRNHLFAGKHTVTEVQDIGTWEYWVGGELENVIVALLLASNFTSTRRCWGGGQRGAGGGRRGASGADIEV